MVKIGLISDTHSHFDDDMRIFLNPVDQIWHAGDIGNAAVLSSLQSFKPTIAVYGNADGSDVRTLVPGVQMFETEQVKVLMTHIGGYPGKYDARVRLLLQTEHPKLFVCGHSHVLKAMYDKQLGCLHLNPGACGLYGFQPKRTMMRFVIDGVNIKDLEIWETSRN